MATPSTGMTTVCGFRILNADLLKPFNIRNTSTTLTDKNDSLEG